MSNDIATPVAEVRFAHEGMPMRRLAPIAVLLSVAAIGTGMTLFVNAAANRAAQSQFDLIVNEAADRLDLRISQQLLLLQATAAHLETSATPFVRADFAGFIKALNLAKNNPGVRGIGFAPLMDTGRDAEAAALITANYALDRKIWPQTTQLWRTPVILIEPEDERNRGALGYDMFNDATRRSAIERAMESGAASATAPVRLVTEKSGEAQNGFLIYVPVSLKSLSVRYSNSKSGVSGFVYSPFRAGDLHNAAWQSYDLPAVFQTVDGEAEASVLAQSPDFETKSSMGAFKADRDINVAGRHWRIHFVSNSAFAGSNWRVGTWLLGIVSMLFAAALATSTHAQLKSVEAANRLAAVSLQASEDKDMMLQEMKHRIKNSIARVLAIARQTASGSNSMEEFSNSFFSRLQSMSAAQELLTRSHWEKADLRELLNGELHQVLGESWSKDRLSGARVSLNARATQALGLTFHELATNALKYGDPEGIESGLSVHWKTESAGGKDVLIVEWAEPGGSQKAGEKAGFGSRLIAMNVERELGGTIERIVDDVGLIIRLTLPLKAVV
jgi:CHASE1-domain containing sensor protein